MKHLFSGLIICCVVFATCKPTPNQRTLKTESKYNTAHSITIRGSLKGYEKLPLDVGLFLNRIAQGLDKIVVNINDEGQFQRSFESYTPLDIFCRGIGANFSFIAYPNDTIDLTIIKNNVNGDVSYEVHFSGNSDTLNTAIYNFQTRFNKQFDAIFRKELMTKRSLDLPEYENHLKYVKTEFDTFYDNFVLEMAPSPEVSIWAKMFLNARYFTAVAMYPKTYRKLHNVSKNEWDVPHAYYDKLLEMLPITDTMFIASNALNKYINRFHFSYAYKQFSAALSNSKYIDHNGKWLLNDEARKKLTLLGLVKYTPDSLMKQMVAAEFLFQQFSNLDFTTYENNKALIEKIIKEPYLIEPLIDDYNQKQIAVNNPAPLKDVQFSRAKSSAPANVLTDILKKFEGKVIYIDCWATWCAPCRNELPAFDRLKDELKDEDVVLVSLCIDSKEANWKTVISDLHLTGNHYLLTYEESNFIKEYFDFSGVPYYIIVNTKGEVYKKGNGYRPVVAKKEIVDILY